MNINKEYINKKYINKKFYPKNTENKIKEQMIIKNDLYIITYFEFVWKLFKYPNKKILIKSRNLLDLYKNKIVKNFKKVG